VGELDQARLLAQRLDRVTKPTAELRQLGERVGKLVERCTALEKAFPAPAAKGGGWSRMVACFACAEQALSEGQPAERIEVLLDAALADGVNFGPAYGLRGHLLLEKGRLTQALADAERAILLSPDEMRGYYVRGRVRLERGTNGALADLERAAVLGKRKDASVLHWLATALFQASRCPEALATQREAVRLQPGASELADQLHRFERTIAVR
jgi:tetratricopeptide (TPR) repeat protein